MKKQKARKNKMDMTIKVLLLYAIILIVYELLKSKKTNKKTEVKKYDYNG